MQKATEAREVAGETLLIEASRELPDEIALDNVLNEFEGSEAVGKVTIWRVMPREPGQRGAGKDSYLATMSPSDFQEYGLEGVQADYGEGDYRIKVHKQNGDLMINRIFAIGPITPRRLREIQTQKPPAPVNGNPGEAGLLAGFQAIANTMQQGFTAILTALQQQGGNRQQFLQELVQYKTLFAQPQAATSGVGDPFGMMKSAVDLVKELGVGDGGGKTTADVFVRLAEEFAPVFAEVAKGMIASGRIPVQAHQPAPQIPQQNQPALPNNSTENAEMDAMSLAFRQYLPILIAHAQADHNPQTYAEMIADSVPTDKIAGFVNRPDWFQYLVSINPNVQPVAPWFERLRAELQNILTEDSQPGMNAGTDGFSTLEG